MPSFPAQVPGEVLALQCVFYRCGVCSQVFWPSGRQAKPSQRGRGGLASSRPAPHGRDGDDGRSRGDGGDYGAPQTAAKVEAWRPSSQMVMALGCNSKSGGQMLREARGLHSKLRKLLDPELAVAANYFY